ncbi:hypothetical protein ACQPZP_25450 [Spirillospora sp. CA-142024]|uniref:hypothetical protein n=1 Tax=Spirillospora sp. CA-142024 TaxID=3240036 RepID=UPI003D8EBB58
MALHSYGVASFLFRSPAEGTTGDLPWNREFLREIFIDNEHSVRNYWRRASLGLIDLEFEFINSIAWILELTQNDAMADRDNTVAAARRFFADNDIVVQGYDHLLIVVPPAPLDWGATPGDVVLEQIDIPLATMQHEVGHTLGFMHAFGPFIPGPFGSLYNDPYCVMGYSGTHEHAVTAPAHLMTRPKSGNAFWRSNRRLSAAALWRNLAEVKLSRERVTYVEKPGPTAVRIFGLCSVGDTHATILAVVPRRGHPEQFLTVEYRPAVGDDAGVTPAVVVHSIGINDVGAGRSEVDPPWFEGAIPVNVGEVMNIHDYRITITDVSATAPESVEVEIRSLDFRLPG